MFKLATFLISATAAIYAATAAEVPPWEADPLGTYTGKRLQNSNCYCTCFDYTFLRLDDVSAYRFNSLSGLHTSTTEAGPRAILPTIGYLLSSEHHTGFLRLDLLRYYAADDVYLVASRTVELKQWMRGIDWIDMSTPKGSTAAMAMPELAIPSIDEVGPGTYYVHFTAVGGEGDAAPKFLPPRLSKDKRCAGPLFPILPEKLRWLPL